MRECPAATPSIKCRRCVNERANRRISVCDWVNIIAPQQAGVTMFCKVGEPWAKVRHYRFPLSMPRHWPRRYSMLFQPLPAAQNCPSPPSQLETYARVLPLSPSRKQAAQQVELVVSWLHRAVRKIGESNYHAPQHGGGRVQDHLDEPDTAFRLHYVKCSIAQYSRAAGVDIG